MAVFYVLHIADKQVSNCIEAIRLICDPSTKHRAHLTVRGPYRQKISIAPINKKLGDQSLTIYGIGEFFKFGQQTVFFRCSSPDLRAVWFKPDYSYNPHITLYDGSSLEFARQLYLVASKYSFNFQVSATDLEPLMSQRGQKTFGTSVGIDYEAIREILGSRFDFAALRDWSLEQRLTAIDGILLELHRRSVPELSSEAIKSELMRALDNSVSSPSPLFRNLMKVLGRVGKRDRLHDPDSMIPLLLVSAHPLIVPGGARQISDLYFELSEAEKEELRVYYLERSAELEESLLHESTTLSCLRWGTETERVSVGVSPETYNARFASNIKPADLSSLASNILQ